MMSFNLFLCFGVSVVEDRPEVFTDLKPVISARKSAVAGLFGIYELRNYLISRQVETKALARKAPAPAEGAGKATEAVGEAVPQNELHLIAAIVLFIAVACILIYCWKKVR